MLILNQYSKLYLLSGEKMTEDAQGVPAINHDSLAVHEHIKMYQGIIERMAKNSASCKQWCIVLIAAIFALVAEKGKVDFAALSLIPLVMFAFLDTYYLAMERKFVDANNAFLTKLKNSEVELKDLFHVAITRGKLPSAMWSAFRSPAIYPFYLGLFVLLVFAKYISINGWVWLW